MSTRDSLLSAFAARFGTAPRLFSAPGRVNLIGDHTDYNDGFVLPMAIDKRTFVAARVRADRRVCVRAHDLGDEIEFDLDAAPDIVAGKWSNYVEGTARILERNGNRLTGANLVIASDVPRGAGLSSSAALEMAVGFALLSLSNHAIDRRELALAGQAAEHEFVGTKCGIMDQFISVFAEEGHALLIDCRSLEGKPVPLDLKRHAFVIADSGVRHELAASEYNTRRAECEEGVAFFQTVLPSVKALRDVTVTDFETYAGRLPDIVRRRVLHVIMENLRTANAPGDLADGDWAFFGKAMTASHDSLAYDYEVSCDELDALVFAARSVDGCLGARMTGGGFGGSTVNLVERTSLNEFLERVPQTYRAATGLETVLTVVTPAGGAGEEVLGVS